MCLYLSKMMFSLLKTLSLQFLSLSDLKMLPHSLLTCMVPGENAASLCFSAFNVCFSYVFFSIYSLYHWF